MIARNHGLGVEYNDNGWYWGIFVELMELFCILIIVVTIKIYTCIKIHNPVHQKVNFTV